MIILIGCFGSSAEDRYRENELDRYLDSLDDHDEEENEDFEDSLCYYCGEERATIIEYLPMNATANTGGMTHEKNCRKCRSKAIKDCNGIRGYYAKYNIKSVELIEN